MLQLVVVDDPALLRGRPGTSCPARAAPCATIRSGAISRAPTSEAMITRSSSVTTYRLGRRPLRSSTAPIDLPSVKVDRRRAVPRLHQAAMIPVEVFLDLRHRLVVLPRLGDQHHHGVRQAVARADQQLDGVVEAGRVAEPLADDRLDLGDVARLVQVGGEEGLARLHPVDIAAQGVDLAVVRDHPIRVGELPARERVGAEPRVEHAQGAGEQRVAQVVGEVEAELLGGEHSLVDQGPAREAGEIEDTCGRRAPRSSISFSNRLRMT